MISESGVKTDPRKVTAMKDWPQPKHKRDVQAFLGTTGYYRRFVPGYAEVSKPLTVLTQSGAKFEWTAKCTEAFDALKHALSQAPVLAYPMFQLPFILDTDASNIACGAVLSQVQDGQERVVAYWSKMLSKEERNYCTTRKELLSVVKAVCHFRNYLYGREFTVRTDHASLTWLTKRTVPSGQVARWLETLSEFDYTIEYRPGRTHNNADGLSRQKCVDCVQCQRHFPTPEGQVSTVSMSPVLNAVIVTAELAKQQQLDSDLQPVYAALLCNEAVPADVVKQGSAVTKRLCQMMETLHIRDDGGMVAKLPVGKKQRRLEVAVCPKELRSELISTTHAEAHLGVSKTLSRIRMNWYWPGMTGEVRRHVNACTTCQQSKTTKAKPAGERQHLFAGRPWQLCAVDLVGPLQETDSGNKWILVLTDHFTRWSDALPLPDARAETVAAVLDERVFCYFGVPETILTDQGRQFESELFQAGCKLWGTKKTRTAPYSPTANGVVERGNRVLGSSLRALLLEAGHFNWDLLLPQVMRAIRATPHTTTGETPNYLMLGRETRLPGTLTSNDNPDVFSPGEYADQLQKRLDEVGCWLRNQQSEQLRTDSSDEPRLYCAGDNVWLKSFFNRKGKSKKLQPKYIGPYHVLEALPHHVYLVERNGKTSVQHEGRMRLRVGDAAPEPTVDIGSPELDKRQLSPRDGWQGPARGGSRNQHIQPVDVEPIGLRRKATPDNSVNPDTGYVITPQPIRRSHRERKTPGHLSEFVLLKD